MVEVLCDGERESNERRGGDMGKVIPFKFDEVLEVLKRMGYDHSDDKVFDACFKNWDNELLEDENAVMAVLIRLVLFSAMSEVVKRLNSGEFDMRDVLIFLMSRGIGLEKVSQTIEVVERGLGVIYEGGDFSVLYAVLDKMFEMFVEKLEDQYEGREVMLQ